MDLATFSRPPANNGYAPWRSVAVMDIAILRWGQEWIYRGIRALDNGYIHCLRLQYSHQTPEDARAECACSCGFWWASLCWAMEFVGPH